MRPGLRGSGLDGLGPRPTRRAHTLPREGSLIRLCLTEGPNATEARPSHVLDRRGTFPRNGDHALGGLGLCPPCQLACPAGLWSEMVLNPTKNTTSRSPSNRQPA